jgi:hypothetical protein
MQLSTVGNHSLHNPPTLVQVDDVQFTVSILKDIYGRTCACGMHLRQVVKGENMTRLAGQVVVLGRHLVVPLHAPSVVVHVS